MFLKGVVMGKRRKKQSVKNCDNFFEHFLVYTWCEKVQNISSETDDVKRVTTP